MTSNNLSSKADGHDVEQQLQDVLRSHQEISVAVIRCANEFTGARRRSWQALGYWFAQGPTPQEVLHRADALGICLPLIDPASRGNVEKWELEEAVWQSIDGVGEHRGQRYRLLQGLIYPFSVLLICGLILICFCLFLVPEFDDMFQEFEMDLPTLTHAVVLLSRFLRQWGVVLLGTSCVVGLLLFWVGKQNLPRWMCTKRDAMATWARHVSLLLRAGVSDGDAVQTAGRASEHRWLSELSQFWGAQIQQGQRPFDGPVYAGSQPVAMIGYAMRRENPQDRSEWLDEVAEMYRERDQFRWNAWLAWCTPLVVCVAGLAVGLLVFALFLPLLSLISGLG